MGRYYNGSISGKFWFGVQSSNILVDLFEFIPEEELCFVGCGCVFYPGWKSLPQAEAWCDDCYENREQHVLEAETQELCVENEHVLNCNLENNDENKKMIKSNLDDLEELIRKIYKFKIPTDKSLKEFLSFEIDDDEYDVNIDYIKDPLTDEYLEYVADWCIGQQILHFLEENVDRNCFVHCDL